MANTYYNQTVFDCFVCTQKFEHILQISVSRFYEKETTANFSKFIVDKNCVV